MSWRPRTLDDYVGQEQAKSRMRVWIRSRTTQDLPLPHMILYGPPGTGKTTLSRILAHERGSKVVEVTGDRIQNSDDVLNLIVAALDSSGFERHADGSLERTAEASHPTIVFVDEVHRIGKLAAESLYHPLEDFSFCLTPDSRDGTAQMVALPPWTFIGATTNAGDLLAPLVRRVKMIYLEPYTPEQMAQIVQEHAERAAADIPFTEEALLEVAKRSRSNPSTAVEHVTEMVDWAVAYERDNVDALFVQSVMKWIGIDPSGLNNMDRRILATLRDAGPLGIEALSHTLGEMRPNIGASEAFLTALGAIVRRPGKGREITAAGLKLLECG